MHAPFEAQVSSGATSFLTALLLLVAACTDSDITTDVMQDGDAPEVEATPSEDDDGFDEADEGNDTTPSGGDTGSIAGSDEAVDDAESLNVAPVLQALAEQIMTPTYAEFVAAALVLEEATTSHAAAPGTESLQVAREAYRAALAIWQRAELFQIGPAATEGVQPGAASLRSLIYSWPEQRSACGVDSLVITGGYAELDDWAAQPLYTRGLDALDWLLHAPDDETACSPFVGARADEEPLWVALRDEPGAVAEARARYAAEVAGDLRASAQDLAARFEAFLVEFVDAGAASGLFESEQQALNAASDALFYLDKEVKDAKVGRPLGKVDCLTALRCPEAVELPQSALSLAAVGWNLDGFSQVYRGVLDPGLSVSDVTSPSGFDGLLRARGADGVRVANAMNDAIDDARAAIESAEGPLAVAVEERSDQVEEVHVSLKAITDLLKTEFTALLELSVPMRAASDND